MPIQINELIIRAEVPENGPIQQSVSTPDNSVKAQKIIDEVNKIILNKNER
jgi:hypothetical protein